MKLATIVKMSFIIGFIATLAGAYLIITHSGGGNTWLTLGIIAWFVFLVSAIYEIRTSSQIDNTEKNIWTIAFIFFSGITGIFYFLVGRRRIAASD